MSSVFVFLLSKKIGEKKQKRGGKQENMDGGWMDG